MPELTQLAIPVIFGINGTELSPDERNLFKHYCPQGFILFSRNIESAQQLTELCRSLKEYGKPILIDQEGGRVSRIKPPIGRNIYPPAQYFGDLYENSQEEALSKCYDNYATIGRVVTAAFARGKGLGRPLMKEAIRQVYSYCGDSISIKLSAQAHLQKYYHSLGFKSQGEVYLEDGIPHIAMIK